MAYDGNGNFALPAGNPVVTGTDISSTVHNNTLAEIAAALSSVITKDGQTTVSANLPMATYRHTNVGNPTARTQYATVAGVQDGTYLYLTSVAGTNTITATATLSMQAYATGQTFVLVPAVTNTGATTINVNSIGAKNVFVNGAACVGGELVAGIPALITYDGTQFALVNTSSFASGIFTRDMTTATGSQAVTGVGFRPRLILFLAAEGSTSQASIGFDLAGSSRASISNRNASAADVWARSGTSYSIYAEQGSGNVYAGGVTSFDADGFTVSWVKSGSPTGTLGVDYLAMR
jgi:hypothetical protein